ncbi:hypothetical protein H6F77_08390 [Microcoleus sp. FACHB-831]|uniref:hypothetical protein n=1 Tax=Microcoleus sp. FACHB-831 TaxID=2692827 RepID=UPI0016885D8C|nr:hypothetical protein [Microcoleus sp. FACHB-831]MBD1921108.1 hypothetical protein [Microcoleus sp. FACHB-831]
MPRPIRVKNCDRCGQNAAILYRVQCDESGEWIFACEKCWPYLSQNNPFYAYGGTWKARKKRS